MTAKQSILVIDDDAAFNHTLCRSLTRRGHRCLPALNGQQALSLLSKNTVGKALLDLRLAEESGISLIEPMLKQQPDLKIVVLTGYASLTTAVQAIKLGAWNYLAKPVGTEAIEHAFTIDTTDTIPTTKLEPTPLKQLEWEHLQRVLAENNGNISATARQLGMHRRTLQRKLQKRVTAIKNT